MSMYCGPQYIHLSFIIHLTRKPYIQHMKLRYFNQPCEIIPSILKNMLFEMYV